VARKSSPPPEQASQWGALMDAERCRLLADPAGSVRRTAQLWLRGQQADARAYSKTYQNAFADRRPPGSASDDLRDPPHVSMQRLGLGRRSAAAQAALLCDNLLLVCKEGLLGSAALPATCVQAMQAVVDAPPAAQMLAARLLYSRGEWHRLSRFSGGDSPQENDPQQAAALQQALQALRAAGLARGIGGATEADQPALISLLKSNELKGLGRAAVRKKSHHQPQPQQQQQQQQDEDGGGGGGGQLEGKLREVAELVQDMRGQLAPPAQSSLWRELARRLGSCAALTEEARAALWQAHVLFFTLANYGPEEAAGLLARPIAQLEFAGPKFDCGHDESASDSDSGADAEAFEEVCAAVRCSDALEWAAVHGDADAAPKLLHQAATVLLSPTAATAVDLSSRCLARLFGAKAKGWWARVVLCGCHLLEREKRYDDARHYLQILLDSGGDLAGNACSGGRGAVWMRYGIDMEHSRRPDQALAVYQQALADPTVVGEWRVAAAKVRWLRSPSVLIRAFAQRGAYVRGILLIGWQSSGAAAALEAAAAVGRPAEDLPGVHGLPDLLFTGPPAW
jgi:hypothetical protein